MNHFCHTVGIPLAAGSVILLLFAFVFSSLWTFAWMVFVVGWVFQFIGHVFERKMPEFFHDWRYYWLGWAALVATKN